MSDDLTQLEDWCAPLLAKLGAGARRTLARTIATQLRRSQSQRIAAQQNPDGSAYAPRKRAPARKKKGRIKQRAMFSKLRTATYLKARASGDDATVEFTARVSRMARVHQDGGTDKVSPRGPTAHYPQRQLLGFTSADRDMIRDLLIEHLAPR